MVLIFSFMFKVTVRREQNGINSWRTVKYGSGSIMLLGYFFPEGTGVLVVVKHIKNIGQF